MPTRSDFANDSLFRGAVQDVYEALAEQFEDILEELEESNPTKADFFEPQLSAGSLTIAFEDNSVFMLSQQTPTHEIWLSANYTAWHFLCQQGQWIERDSGDAMTDILAQLLCEKIGLEVQIQL
ncbi:MAG: iron donor protein CyaY [Proteobacteria bacterium]|nr:iron donor protein CyaY [Pseudomonadota bacterium]